MTYCLFCHACLHAFTKRVSKPYVFQTNFRPSFNSTATLKLSSYIATIITYILHQSLWIFCDSDDTQASVGLYPLHARIVLCTDSNYVLQVLHIVLIGESQFMNNTSTAQCIAQCDCSANVVDEDRSSFLCLVVCLRVPYTEHRVLQFHEEIARVARVDY